MTSFSGLFFVLGALVYTCYGGGFGTMPATPGDYSGVRHAGAVYGAMIVAWSMGGVVGPQIAARLIGDTKNSTSAYTVIAVTALASLVLPFVTRMPRQQQAPDQGFLGQAVAPA